MDNNSQINNTAVDHGQTNQCEVSACPVADDPCPCIDDLAAKYGMDKIIDALVRIDVAL